MQGVAAEESVLPQVADVCAGVPGCWQRVHRKPTEVQRMRAMSVGRLQPVMVREELGFQAQLAIAQQRFYHRALRRMRVNQQRLATTLIGDEVTQALATWRQELAKEHGATAGARLPAPRQPTPRASTRARPVRGGAG